jgi:hypothetical protein
MKTKKYEAMIRNNTPAGYPNLTVGWPDHEHGIHWDAYRSDCLDLVDAMQPGDDAPVFKPFKEWCESERDKIPDRNDLGFYTKRCCLCQSFPGDRFAVTAFDDSMEDYDTLAVCNDCLIYIANGETPNYVSD